MKKLSLFAFLLIALFSLPGLQADCGCCCCHADHCDTPQVQEADAATLKAMLEEDPFGEQEVDDATITPPAPKDAIKMQQPTVSQALLQRAGCVLISGYLMCVNCLNSLWNKVSSLY